MSNNNPWNADRPKSYDGMWLSASLCNKNINIKISGKDIHWLNYVIDDFILPAINRCKNKRSEDWNILLLGSNEGHMEQAIYNNGYKGHIVASDIADMALERAKAKSETIGIQNITYITADLNQTSFDEKFDFIIAEGVLHHIKNIESCLLMLNDCLKEDGLMFVAEFEGPFRFQLPEEQVRWINAALNLMPKELRPFPKTSSDEEAILPASLKENSVVYYVHPTEESIVEFDPSEAICGPQLKELIPKIFNVITKKGFGGTLLSYMTGHFDFQRTNVDEFARSWLEILINIEDTLIKNKILQDEFVFYILSRKKIQL